MNNEYFFLIVMKTIKKLDAFFGIEFNGEVFTYNDRLFRSLYGGYFIHTTGDNPNQLSDRIIEKASMIKTFKSMPKKIKKGNNKDSIYISLLNDNVNDIVKVITHEYGHFYEVSNEELSLLQDADHDSAQWKEYCAKSGYHYHIDDDNNIVEYVEKDSFTEYLIDSVY